MSESCDIIHIRCVMPFSPIADTISSQKPKALRASELRFLKKERPSIVKSVEKPKLFDRFERVMPMAT